MFKNYSLYLVTSESASKGRKTLEVVERSISGGVDIVQMREKNLSREDQRSLGLKINSLCSNNGVKFIVNDDPYLAKELGASGVHLGQEDMLKFPIAWTRELLGKDKIIGVSTHSLDQFKQAECLDVDYIAFGPVFPTKTKDYFIGTGDIETILGEASKPVVFIGGINQENIKEILNAGGKNIAVIRAITQAEDIRGRVKQLKEIMKNSK